MPEQEVKRLSRDRQGPELRHYGPIMAYNGSRLRLMTSNIGNDVKDTACKIVVLGCHGVGKTGR